MLLLPGFNPGPSSPLPKPLHIRRHMIQRRRKISYTTVNADQNTHSLLFGFVFPQSFNTPVIVLYLITDYVYYLLTPWSRVLLEKLTGSQLVKKPPHFLEPES